MKRWLLISLVIAGLALLMMLLANEVLAHDWYKKMRDPEFSQSNCCENDCGEVDPQSVTEIQQGYRLRLTSEQVKKLDKTATLPVDAIIPWRRVQSVPRGKKGLFHACIIGNDRSLPRGGVRCFFATPTM